MKVLLLAFSLSLSSVAFGQRTEDSVKLVISEFFAALKQADGKAIRECLSDSAILQTIAQKNGSVTIIHEEIEAFIRLVSGLRPGEADEQFAFTPILVDADLATAWTPYKFYYKGAFSHCGVNSFQLVRLGNKWKIISIIDTRRKSNCPG